MRKILATRKASASLAPGLEADRPPRVHETTSARLQSCALAAAFERIDHAGALPIAIAAFNNEPHACPIAGTLSQPLSLAHTFPIRDLLSGGFGHPIAHLLSNSTPIAHSLGNTFGKTLADSETTPNPQAYSPAQAG